MHSNKSAETTPAPHATGTMYAAVRHWAAHDPGAIAFVDDDRAAMSYRALLAVIDGIGAELNRCGLGRNDRVAIVHPGGAEMAITIMGVWSHATAVPLNPDYSIAEFTIYLRDLRVKALAIAEGIDSPARTAAHTLDLPVFEIINNGGSTTGMVALNGVSVGAASIAGPAQTDDHALLLNTSGTTSHSKIVPIRHRQLMARCRNVATRLELTPGDRCLNLMPLYHSHGLNSGLGVSIAAGASVIAMPRFDVERFFRCIVTLEPTWFTGVFTFHHQIHAHAAAHKAAIVRSRLRFIHTSSGRLDPRIAREMESLFEIPMIGTFASTETGIIAGDSQPPAQRKRDSVGTPAGGQLAIFGDDGTQLSAGARGEVYVRGENVFDGYENDAAANAAAFTDGWFGTGDEGMLDEDGFLFLTGRIKESINRGGEKISPSEVDDALLRHPDVSAAATFAIPHITLGEEVAAAVVLNVGASLSDKDVARFLRQRLSKFKVPRHILMVDQIPKGPTGKVQRHMLASAFGLDKTVETARVQTGRHDRATTPLESQLQRLWGQTLGLTRVGLHDDFFLLGGDSLQAVELFMRIENTLGRRLPRSVLFEAGTIAEMAHRIEDAAPPECLVAIRAEGSRAPFFCVHGIDGGVLYFRDLARHLDAAQPFYGIQSVGLDGGDAPLTRIEDMAAHYIREIRKFQPAGPYYLGGYSFGGWVALEMAQQLRTNGEPVALLALLDAFAGNRSSWSQLRTAPARWLRRRMLAAACRLCEPAGRSIPRGLGNLTDINAVAAMAYQPTPYDGDAVLFEAEPTATFPSDGRESWRPLFQGALNRRPVPGTHDGMMYEPQVRALAAALETYLSAS